VSRIGLLLAYPGCTALDLIGPQYFLAGIPRLALQVVAAQMDAVVTDGGLQIMPDVTFDDAPAAPFIVLVPGGGRGTIDAMRDAATLAWLRATAPDSTIIASTCTGALLLGMAGLLEGRRATTHWLLREALLPRFGATAVNARLVEDGDLITSAGVTAGLDLGMALARRLGGEAHAALVRQISEYPDAPASSPPFPSELPGFLTAQAMVAPMLADALEIVARAEQ
jgi:transcriptional regulator GlxA family with amidase domain